MSQRINEIIVDLKSLLSKSTLELRKARISTSELDAKVLLLDAIKKDNSFVFSHPEYLITNSEYSKFRRNIRRRKRGEPIAYITGYKEFFGNNFFVNKNVLIPRPETEWLVERGTEFLVQYSVKDVISSEAERSSRFLRPQHQLGSRNDKVRKVNVLDIGTGSGCIIISLLKNIQHTERRMLNANFYATDISKKALTVAKKNAKQHKIDDQIKFFNSDLFLNKKLHKKFDLIIANLPYVPNTKLKVKSQKLKVLEGIDFEPEEAIFTGDKGMDIIKRLILDLKKYLKGGGVAMFEIDSSHANSLKIFAQKNLGKSCSVQIEKDGFKEDRYLAVSPLAASSFLRKQESIK